ncbi:hypothetical protein BH20VER1_BH20VER1_25900 [soil metagenome]
MGELATPEFRCGVARKAGQFVVCAAAPAPASSSLGRVPPGGISEPCDQAAADQRGIGFLADRTWKQSAGKPIRRGAVSSLWCSKTGPTPGSTTQQFTPDELLARRDGIAILEERQFETAVGASKAPLLARLRSGSRWLVVSYRPAAAGSWFPDRDFTSPMSDELIAPLTAMFVRKFSHGASCPTVFSSAKYLRLALPPRSSCLAACSGTSPSMCGR